MEFDKSKVLKWTDLKVGDIIRKKTSGFSALITAIDAEDETVYIHNQWLFDNQLNDWEKVNV